MYHCAVYVGDKLQFDKGGVSLWLTVQSSANRYEYTERSDICPISSKVVQVYISFETASISQNRADIDSLRLQMGLSY